MADFLFELGLEEVPARMLADAEAELLLRVREMLGRERLIAEDAAIESFSTPRRLAVLVHGVAQQQPDAEEELTGPPVKAAFKDGAPTAAAHAFAKKAGVAVEELRTVTNAKGEYLAATLKHAGKPAADVIAAELPREIAAIYWAKNMYWRPGKPERFVRPVQWIVALLDETVVPVEWAGRAAGNLTYGHRVLHGAEPVRIAQPAGYGETLRSASVLANVEERRHRIRKALDHVTRTVPNARWREDHALVDKTTHLTEWPSVILGSFEPEYLALPEEVLVTVMRDHQNYFALEGTDGKLLPHFLAVLNTEVSERAQSIIRHGNERVIRARFNDARFFYEFDQRTPLQDRVALLDKVTFQRDLGSYAAKTERVRAVATKLGALAKSGGKTIDLGALDTAAQLSKTDLTSELVKEFTELQGVVGGLYARAQGLGEPVAMAIYDQYLPASMEDEIPRTLEGVLLSMADKADTIGGMFGLGLQPTGSKDPFALRRAANGVIKMLAESTLPLTLTQVVEAAGPNAAATLPFLRERLEWYLREVRGAAYDVVNAVMATAPDDVRDAMNRVDAVSSARQTEDFAAISAAFKRMRNIVEQAQQKGERFASPEDAAAALSHDAEKQLALEAETRAAQVEMERSQGNYDGALRSIAEMRPAVDAFFDKVMVMAPEPELRAARLGLLRQIVAEFTRIADFSQIVTGA
ncbi:glycine--tRNA ligase subunit beta [Terriglobus aquaticus]|uniref:Glycine--tRNA ligase beta subunit n=1 Tax=Terriglobus aquaticus TaxID=940139 RepID=A0ABW9KMY9_9BACT|nr:glycine--tRNA ligase subunit beta [Terriglobus aquaticus]